MKSPSDIFEERRKELGLSGVSKSPICIYCGDEIVEKQSCIMFGSYSSNVSHLNYAHMKCAKKYGWKVQEG